MSRVVPTFTVLGTARAAAHCEPEAVPREQPAELATRLLDSYTFVLNVWVDGLLTSVEAAVSGTGVARR